MRKNPLFPRTLGGIREDVLGSPLIRRMFLVGVLFLSLLRVATYFDYLRSTAAVANDFTPDYASAREWRSDGNAYAPLEKLYVEHLGPDGGIIDYRDPEQRNAHPPFLILLLAPLSVFPLRTARAILFFVVLGATFAGVFLFARRVGYRPRPAAILSSAALALPIVQSDMQYAQINGLMLLGIVWAWRDLKDGRERRAGWILGVVAAAKIFPWLLLVPILRAKRRRAAFSFALVAFGLSVAAALIIGITPTREFLSGGTLRNVTEWSHGSVLSLVSAPHQWFSMNGSGDVSGSALVGASILGVLFFVTLLAIAMRTPAGISGDLYWATIPIMILASPLAWPHYLVLAVPLGVLAFRRFRFEPSAVAMCSVASIWLLLAGLQFLIWLGVLIGRANRILALGLLVLVVLTDLVPRGGAALPSPKKPR